MQRAALRVWPQQAVNVFFFAAQRFVAVAHRTLDAAAGKAGVIGVALALDGVVDDVHGLARAHVDGADGVEENGSSFFKHGRWLLAGVSG